jgi:hypothetical protein
MIAATGVKGDLVGEAIGKSKASPKKGVKKAEGGGGEKKRKRVKTEIEDSAKQDE